MDLMVNGDVKSASLDELLHAQALIWNHTFRFMSSFSLKCAVELEIPDIIYNHGQPMTLETLALSLSINPSKHHALHRLMRTLIHSGFFAEHKINSTQKGYVLTLASTLLLKDNPLSSRHFLLAILDPILLKPWECISAWFRNGDDPAPFNKTYGMNTWDYAQHEPRLNHMFNEALVSDGQLVANVLLSKCKGVFEGLKSLVDVGGGTGTITKILAKAFPDMNCVVLDLPHVVAGMQGSGNVKFVAGDMFYQVPPTNAIMLKWILHDWNDEECIKILKVCKEALIRSKDKGVNSKVIIIDIVMEGTKVDEQVEETKLLWDMEMMVCARGQERNEQKWSKLFVAAGFSDYKINRVLGLRSLIELFP